MSDEKQSINGAASAVVENECPTTSNGHLFGPETEAGRVEASAEEDNSLDAILVRIGQFGRFQLINYALLCVPMVFNAFFSISYVFTASTVVQRCNITQCDSPDSLYEAPWLNFTVPYKNSAWDSCSRYVSVPETQSLSSSLPSTEFCSEEYFGNKTESCGTDFKFRDEEKTISTEFNIFCQDEWKLSLVGTINNVGQFVGIPLGGYFADRYGRRTMLAIAGSLSALMGIIRSLSTNYSMFLCFEFLDMAVGSTLFPTAFLLAIELVGPKRRVAAATIITIFYSIGEAMLGVLAAHVQDWRWLLRVLYAPAILHVLMLWILPESVRWLLCQGEEKRAAAVLKRAAEINKRPLPEAQVDQLLNSNRQKLQQANESQYPISQAARLFAWRIANCCFCWFTHTLIALGLSLNSVNLGGNKYNNFMFNGFVQIPGLILPLVIMDRIGRRYSLCISMLICAICMAASAAVGPDDYAGSLTLFLIGKLAITCSFQILYFFTSEMFPTNVRNSLLSFCSMIGRIGSMLAPQTPLLAKYYKHAPSILFATFALVSGFLTLGFPETADKVLPTTMEDARDLDAPRQHSDFPEDSEEQVAPSKMC
ncbi:PREDICTED: organic cation transporter protein-like [Drosophila arizonae]|uniref:Organic cation transporter protein-like n=1 Tax=Drosophila arizonae TaxID=7263 RepID=A0ABM1P8L1_DROAR|nr:PREDICTED: organic cation transporter protein-like [Drosophila arizonae]